MTDDALHLGVRKGLQLAILTIGNAPLGPLDVIRRRIEMIILLLRLWSPHPILMRSHGCWRLASHGEVTPTPRRNGASEGSQIAVASGYKLRKDWLTISEKKKRS